MVCLLKVLECSFCNSSLLFFMQAWYASRTTKSLQETSLVLWANWIKAGKYTVLKNKNKKGFCYFFYYYLSYSCGIWHLLALKSRKRFFF